MSSTYSVRDLCERYGVSAHTILAWINRGELRAVNRRVT
jgi:excisionase family DNA binding protein